jgi:hypothetical protein
MLLTQPADDLLDIADERAYIEGLTRRIVAKCPRRKSTSGDERRAQQMLASELSALGLRTQFVPFRFNSSLYAVLALHFGLASVASGLYLFYKVAANPDLFYCLVAALALHLFVAVSYLGDSTYSFYWLRRLLRHRPSQNMVATLPAAGPVRLRIVLVGHADAAPTGWIFKPSVVRTATNNYYPRPFRFLRKQLVGAIIAMSVLALHDLMAIAQPGQWMPVLFFGLTAACAIPFFLNMQLVLRNQIVPGASDNLTGCVSLPVLAKRLADKKPDDVELVFVATSCEEAGCGGSLALARGMGWEKHKTVILGLDILTNGDLRYKQCGEILPLPVAPWLYDTLQEVAASDARWGTLPAFDAPAGSDDVAPFLAKGYEGVCLCCIDPTLGVSRHYHQPTDTPDNLEYDRWLDSIDFAEKVVGAIIRRRQAEATALALGEPLPPAQGEPPQPYFPRVLAGWHVWLAIGPAAGLYWGLVASATWDTAFFIFKWVWLTFVLTFPLFLTLARLRRNPDRSPVAQTYVFFLLNALGISFLGLFVQPALDAAVTAWNATGPTAHAIGLGAILGIFAALPVAIWHRARTKTAPARALLKRLGE